MSICWFWLSEDRKCPVWSNPSYLEALSISSKWRFEDLSPLFSPLLLLLVFEPKPLLKKFLHLLLEAPSFIATASLWLPYYLASNSKGKLHFIPSSFIKTNQRNQKIRVLIDMDIWRPSFPHWSFKKIIKKKKIHVSISLGFQDLEL